MAFNCWWPLLFVVIKCFFNTGFAQAQLKLFESVWKCVPGKPPTSKHAQTHTHTCILIKTHHSLLVRIWQYAMNSDFGAPNVTHVYPQFSCALVMWAKSAPSVVLDRVLLQGRKTQRIGLEWNHPGHIRGCLHLSVCGREWSRGSSKQDTLKIPLKQLWHIKEQKWHQPLQWWETLWRRTHHHIAQAVH